MLSATGPSDTCVDFRRPWSRE